MQKTDFVAAIAERTGIPRKQARHVVEAAIDIITEELQKGERVVLTGFGTFEVRERRERQGVNPQTKEAMRIAATRTPGFSASNSLKDAVRRTPAQIHE
jgi:DNA-binding protein HU-beta